MMSSIGGGVDFLHCLSRVHHRKPRHHLGGEGAVNVAGTFENHVVSKTCFAIG